MRKNTSQSEPITARDVYKTTIVLISGGLLGWWFGWTAPLGQKIDPGAVLAATIFMLFVIDWDAWSAKE